MVNALRILKWGDGSRGLVLVIKVRRGSSEKAGIWGGRIDWPLRHVYIIKLSGP